MKNEKMKKIFVILFVLFVNLVFSQEDYNDLYKSSIQNSIYPAGAVIDTSLVKINKENKDLIRKNINGEEYILVVSSKQSISYYTDSSGNPLKTYNTGNYPIWITTAPELKQWFYKKTFKDRNLRLVQLLGLPPNSKCNYFIEFWVRPQDLFRPCPDKEITDGKCDLCFPNDITEEHLKWINENRISRYYQCDLSNQYPWTQLGYTYDWEPSNKTHIGLSEFIINSNSTIYINSIYTTDEYLDEK
jgi:hypothetical protein